MMTSTTTMKDPVCGMDVEMGSAAGQTDLKGRTYFFCGSRCKEKFDLNPEQYLSKSAGTPKSGHGCCS
jgi:P-type Cu+ transporter